MKNFKLIVLMSAVMTAGVFTACVTKDNTPPPPEAPAKKEAPPKTVQETPKSAETPKPAEQAAGGAAAGGDLAAKGKAIFEGAGACAGCHGKDGKPVIQLPNIPNFQDAAWQQKEKDETWTQSLKNGKAAMPKYTAGPETDIPALIAYVRTLKK